MIRKQFNSIDLMKFVASILVIVVHTYPFFESFPDVGFTFSNLLGRILIPFFFVSSGYFLEKGNALNDSYRFKNQILRLIKLYLIWSIIYIPFGVHLLQSTMKIDGLLWGAAGIMAIFNVGTYYHLWYMAGLIFSMIVAYFYLKKFSIKSLLIISGVLFMIGLIETYYGAFQNTVFISTIDIYFAIFFTTRNGVFFGILYVALGIWIGRINLDEKIKHPFMISIVFFIALTVEAFSVKNLGWAIDYNLYLMAVPFTVFWFCGLLKKNITFNLNYRKLREYSTIIYFSHGIFLELVPILLGTTYAYLYDIGAFRLLSCLIPTLILSYIIDKKFPILK